MRAGGKMVRANIITTSNGKIGIGRLIHHMVNVGQISGKLLKKVPVIYYLITTQFWVLTGNNNHCKWDAIHMSDVMGCLLFLVIMVHGLSYDWNVCNL